LIVRPAYFSLGTNQGDRAAFLRLGVSTMVAGGEAARCSSVFETAPWGGVEQDNFWNLVLEVTTTATPSELLARAHAAEAAAGRVRDVRWGPRTLDVDIVLIEGETVSTETLEVPHPRMYLRRFVLAPLQQLRPDLVTAASLTAADGDVTDLGTLDSLD